MADKLVANITDTLADALKIYGMGPQQYYAQKQRQEEFDKELNMRQTEADLRRKELDKLTTQRENTQEDIAKANIASRESIAKENFASREKIADLNSEHNPMVMKLIAGGIENKINLSHTHSGGEYRVTPEEIEWFNAYKKGIQPQKQSSGSYDDLYNEAKNK